jgi:hypothetical protein
MGTGETGPAGTWVIQPMEFHLNLILDASNGITEDIQGTIQGTLTISESAGALSGVGSCSWTTRRHIARQNQTTVASGTESVSVTGSLDGEDARLILTGCAWSQIGYRGTFAQDRYELAIPQSADAPLFSADVWAEARFLDGDDPSLLVLTRD